MVLKQEVVVAAVVAVAVVVVVVQPLLEEAVMVDMMVTIGLIGGGLEEMPTTPRKEVALVTMVTTDATITILCTIALQSVREQSMSFS